MASTNGNVDVQFLDSGVRQDYYDLLLVLAREHLSIPALDKGSVRINDKVYTCVYEPEYSYEMSHETGHKVMKTPLLTVSRSFVKITPGVVYGKYKENIDEVVLRLSRRQI